MISFATRTHPGNREGQNEDSVGADPTHSTWFVADGMGGHAAGSVASNLVKEALLSVAGTVPLTDAVLRAHQTVAADAASTPEHAGMGSTVVAITITGSSCTVVWVGDSRAYLWRGDRLRPLTRDHSLVERLRTEENLSTTLMRVHPQRHVVTQTLGIGSPVPSRRDERLRSGDWILLCSDGLNDELTDADIADVLRASKTPDEAGDALIAAALTRGGHDNVSVIIVDCGKIPLSFSLASLSITSSLSSLRSLSHAHLSSRAVMVLSIVAGAFAALLVAAAWALLSRR
jgi:protein phosphatase